MNRVLCVLAAALLVGGCSNDWSAGLADRPATADRLTQTLDGGIASSPTSDPAFRDGRARSFANAPDRGSLVQYPQTEVVRRSGAYTFHAVDLSEEHALRSTATGDLSFAAPDGTQITLAYERHVEHPDGNWSWIGRASADQGESTVITFGENAVFGTIPQGGDKPDLRLTVADGRAWVVSADPRLLREIRNEATHPTRPDFLVPGDLATAVGASAEQMDSAGTGPASDITLEAATLDGNTIVDVLVGFTDGYSSYRGGDSAAVTRIHNLVDITNQAFANSQVAVRARLVRSMKVVYPDATANKTALEEMTGFRAPSTRTTPVPAFSGLRSARDQFGADLVVLLRRFQEPENGNCGVAWLIGGGLRGIDSSDQFFGYSVVSDGQDTGADGKTYFCREETFAHELGHNMGSQHDSENAKKDDGSVSYGAFRYSFGLKTGAGGGNFITVMGSADTGQTRYRVFSNPSVSMCGGFACGVANESDNARSLRATAPTVAGFRPTVVPLVPLDPAEKVAHDFNGDGRSDILWRNSSTGANTIWPSASTSNEQAVTRVADLAWVIAGVGDFNRDGRDDLLWRNTSSGANRIWLSAASTTEQVLASETDLAWKVAGVGDFDGDGTSDILWRHAVTGANRIWRAGNAASTQAVTRVGNLAWNVAGVGDFNGDGRSDILWRNSSTGANTIWPSASTANERAVIRVANQAWIVAGVGDFTGDGVSDILWRNTSTGANTIWPSAGIANERAVTRVANQAWVVAAVGDYNGDGASDILWRNLSTGANTIWPSAGTANEQAVTRVTNQAWRIIGD